MSSVRLTDANASNGNLKRISAPPSCLVKSRVGVCRINHLRAKVQHGRRIRGRDFTVYPPFTRQSLTAVSNQNGRNSALLGGSVEAGTAGAFRGCSDNSKLCFDHKASFLERVLSNQNDHVISICGWLTYKRKYLTTLWASMFIYWIYPETTPWYITLIGLSIIIKFRCVPIC